MADEVNVWEYIAFSPKAGDKWRLLVQRECDKTPRSYESYQSLRAPKAYEQADGQLLLRQETGWGVVFEMLIPKDQWVFLKTGNPLAFITRPH